MSKKFTLGIALSYDGTDYGIAYQFDTIAELREWTRNQINLLLADGRTWYVRAVDLHYVYYEGIVKDGNVKVMYENWRD